MTTRTAHYVLSTHWDREWYQHFQDYRFRLVQLLDRILDGWRQDRLHGPFTTDGQAILLDDYLEIRPERQAEIEQRSREGKLVIGPWYVLPDEFLVSGESLVRNLQFGRRLARQYGGNPSNAGFLCDMFGHNSQMPQIFAGFGIRAAFVWRGINLAEQRLFRWQAADGSQALAYRFGWGGYCDFSRSVRASHQKNLPFDLDSTRANFETFLNLEAARTPAQTVLLFDGGDHMEWDQPAYQVVLEQMDRADERFVVVHSTLDQYLAQLLAEPLPEGPLVSGELREPAQPPDNVDRQWLIPGVLSSRVWIKQQNAACQALLCQWAEPFSALAWQALGMEVPQGFLDTAWKWLLQNHPHDSICGCSIDAVHEDMKYRFAQAHTLANRLTSDVTQKLAASVAGEVGENQLRVVVFNPLAVPFNQVAELSLDIPNAWPVYGEMGNFEPKPAFRIYSSAGLELPYQHMGQAANRKRFRMFESGFPKGYQVNEVRVSLPLEIPALGYSTLIVVAGQENHPTRHPVVPGLATGQRSMENEFLAVEIESNGALTVRDKRSGQVYTRWLTFEDCADIGDGWNHGPAVNDQRFFSVASAASVALVHNGPHLAAFRIRIALEIPSHFDFGPMARAEAFERLVIDTLVSLRAGQDRLEMETVVHNTVRDHRLRVLFPSGAQAATYLADSPFDVVERSVALRPDNHHYREMEIETKPQQTWTAVFDERRGIAVVATGLLETAVMDVPERILALTLFRSTGRTVFTNGEPGGQLQGELRFRYWVVPLAGPPERAELCRLGQLLEAGLRCAQQTTLDVDMQRALPALPDSGSLLAVSGPVVVSSVQRKPAGLQVRLWNPYQHAVKAAVRPAWQPPGVAGFRQVNLEGDSLGVRQPLVDGHIELEVPAKKIITVQLEE